MGVVCVGTGVGAVVAGTSGVGVGPDTGSVVVVVSGVTRAGTCTGV